MNKRFSTLLAAVMVAGGLSSTAMATDKTVSFKVNEYVQLTLESKFLVVGEGTTRDSLALQDKGDNTCATLEEFNKTLWKLNVTPEKDQYGLVTGYKLSLENKVYGPVVLTHADADASKSLYYAPGAVVAAGEGYVLTTPEEVAYDEKKDEISFTGDELATVLLSFGNGATGAYDPATKTKVGYKLLKTDGGVIKLLKGSIDVSKLETAADINAAEPVYKTTGDDLGFEISKAAETQTMSATWLNAIDNGSFNLFFNKDISENAAFENPFSATALTAETTPLYTAATYDVDAYEAALEAVKEAKISEGLTAVNNAVDAYAKEVKVALAAEGSSAAIIGTAAANKAEITAAKAEIAEAVKVLAAAADGNIAQAIADFQTAADAYAYEKVDEKFVVKDAKTKATAVDNTVKAIKKSVSDANTNIVNSLSKFEAAIKAFVGVNYRYAAGEVPAYADYKATLADGKTKAEPQKQLATEAAKLVAANKTLLDNLVAAVPTITASKVVSETGYMPYAVVGQGNTYITVDTNYVASKEKYLALTTTKLNKIAVWKEADAGKHAQYEKVDLSKNTFNETTMEYRLVPDLGKWTYPTLFEMTTTVNNAEYGDYIAIKGYGFNEPAAGEFYRETADAAGSFTAANIVIRTLAKSREASIMQENEDEAVLQNTLITFTSPKLATLVKDGAIYHVISMNSEKKAEYGKFKVAIPASETSVFAKEAFVNVPGTQWVAQKNVAKYTFENRDFDVPALTGKLYVVGDEADMIYTTGVDTFQLKEITPAEDEHLGYKFITEPIQQISDYVLSAINYANPEVPFFLTFDGNADSTLVAAKDKETSLDLRVLMAKDKDGKFSELTEAYAMNDNSLEKQYYQLYAKAGKDTLYLNVNDDNELVVTKVPTDLLLQFRNVNNEANEYEVLVGEADDATGDITYNATGKISYNQKGQAVVVALDEATAFVYDLQDRVTDIYKNFEITEPTDVIISLDGDPASKVTAVKPFAVVKRTGLELKAAATDNDFVLGLDTAYVNRKNNIRYAYYITKPIEVEKVGSFDAKAYMVSYNDSIVAKRSNDTVKYEQDNLTRIGFVHAQRVEFGDNDSLAIAKPKAVDTDTINVVGNKGITPATWAFAIESDGTYRIETAADANGSKYVSYLNGILVLGNREQAQLFNVNTTDLTPTDNEVISTSEVKVIAANGGVQIIGAAGKKVVITNILGQTVANTVLSSDNATIAAPAGVVVVAIEGEEAVKAIVK